MIGSAALGKLLSAAAATLGAASAVASHASWWLRYHVNGTTREEPGNPEQGPGAEDS